MYSYFTACYLFHLSFPSCTFPHPQYWQNLLTATFNSTYLHGLSDFRTMLTVICDLFGGFHVQMMQHNLPANIATTPLALPHTRPTASAAGDEG